MASTVAPTAAASSNDGPYILEPHPPTADEHFTLRQQAGLTPPPRPESDVSLRNTWFGLTVRLRADGSAVGMGRIVGDGAIFLTVVDVCILPTHQRKGLGGRIMGALVEYADQHAPRAHLSLLADPPGVDLYKRHGFLVDPYETPMLRSEYFVGLRNKRADGKGALKA